MIKVTVRYSKKAQASPELMSKLRQPMLLAEAMAQTVSDRVQKRGDTATVSKGYAGPTGGKSRYSVTKEYAELVGLHATRYRSSASFHQLAGTRPGTYRVTGGMWAGLQARNYGSDGAIIEFAGSSLGSDRKSARTKTGRERTRPVKVLNREKAGRVFQAMKLNVLQPKDSENEAVGAAVCRWSQRMLGAILGAEIGTFTSSADPTLLQAILRRYDGSR